MTSRARGVAVAALATLALAGCAQPDLPAAVVEGVPVSSRAVQQAAPVLEPYLQASVDPVSQSARDHVLGRASVVLAERNGVALGDDVVNQGIDASPILQIIARTPGGAEIAASISRTNIVVEALGESAYLEQLAGLDITLSPKFGAWSPTPPFVQEASLSYTAPTGRLG